MNTWSSRYLIDQHLRSTWRFDLLQRATSARPQAARGRVTWPDSTLTTAGKQLSVINVRSALSHGRLHTYAVLRGRIEGGTVTRARERDRETDINKPIRDPHIGACVRNAETTDVCASGIVSRLTKNLTIKKDICNVRSVLPHGFFFGRTELAIKLGI